MDSSNIFVNSISVSGEDSSVAKALDPTEFLENLQIILGRFSHSWIGNAM